MGSEKSGTIKLGLTGIAVEQMNRFKDFTLTKLQVVPDYFKKKYPNGVTMFDEIFGIIKSSKNIRPYLETVAGEPCHVVEITYIKGQQSEPEEKDIFWIAQDKGMCLMKYQKYENNKMTGETEVEQIAMADMDGTFIWYPVKVRRHGEGDHIGNITEELIVKQFIPNVKVDENTFRFDFPKGTEIFDRIRNIYGIDLPEEPPSLVHKHLPSVEDFNIELDLNQIEYKVILLCFFDLDQRPSRNCIMQLNKRAQELKGKDVVLFAIQASKVDDNELRLWTQKYKINFPVGMIHADEEKIRFAWGVRSLPWFILTDKEHIIAAEGFSVTDLDQKLNDNSNQ